MASSSQRSPCKSTARGPCRVRCQSRTCQHAPDTYIYVRGLARNYVVSASRLVTADILVVFYKNATVSETLTQIGSGSVFVERRQACTI